MNKRVSVVYFFLAFVLIFAVIPSVFADSVAGSASKLPGNICTGFNGIGMSYGCSSNSSCCKSAPLYPNAQRGHYVLIATKTIGPATDVRVTNYSVDDAVIVRVTSADYTNAPSFIARKEYFGVPNGQGSFVARAGTTSELINGVSGDSPNVIGCVNIPNENPHGSVSIPISYFSATSDNTINVYACMNDNTLVSDHWVKIDYTPATPPNPPADTHAPTGYLDVLTCSGISGWTCDLDSPGTQLALHLYDGSSFLTDIPSTLTGDSRPDVAAAGFCAGNSNHGFNVAFPAFLKDNQPHSVRIYAIGTPDNNKNTNLDSPAGVNGATLTCAPVHGDGYCGVGETAANAPTDCIPSGGTCNPACGSGFSCVNGACQADNNNNNSNGNGTNQCNSPNIICGGQCISPSQCISITSAQLSWRFTDSGNVISSANANQKVRAVFEDQTLAAGTGVSFEIFRINSDGVKENIRVGSEAFTNDSHGAGKASVEWNLNSDEIKKLKDSTSGGNLNFRDNIRFSVRLDSSVVNQTSNPLTVVLSNGGDIITSVKRCSEYTTSDSCRGQTAPSYQRNELKDFFDCGTGGKDCTCEWNTGSGKCEFSGPMVGFTPDQNGAISSCSVDVTDNGPCVDGTRAVKSTVSAGCPAGPTEVACGIKIAELPFFGTLEFIISVLGISLIYTLVVRKND